MGFHPPLLAERCISCQYRIAEKRVCVLFGRQSHVNTCYLKRWPGLRGQSQAKVGLKRFLFYHGREDVLDTACIYSPGQTRTPGPGHQCLPETFSLPVRIWERIAAGVS